jgi:hypothetical protein
MKVNVNIESVENIADCLSNDHKPNTWKVPNLWWEGSPAEEVQYFFFGNAINFGFFTGRRYVNKQSSSDMWSTLNTIFQKLPDPVRKHFPFSSAIAWAVLDKIYFAHFFSWMDERKHNWSNMIKILGKKYNYLAINLIADCENEIEYLEKTGEFRAFDDPLHKLQMVLSYFLHGRKLIDWEPSLPAIDYHMCRIALRTGIVEMPVQPEWYYLRMATDDEKDIQKIRGTTMDAFKALVEMKGISGEICDNIFWGIAKKYCHDNNPDCENCPLKNGCRKNTQFKTPWMISRWF